MRNLPSLDRLIYYYYFIFFTILKVRRGNFITNPEIANSACAFNILNIVTNNITTPVVRVSKIEGPSSSNETTLGQCKRGTIRK